MIPFSPFLLLASLAAACDPDFESILAHKCDAQPYRSFSSTFLCAVSTPLGFNCAKFAVNGGSSIRLLVSDSRAQTYLRKGFWADANSQICETSWSGLCNGRQVAEDLCYSVVTEAKTWPGAAADCASREMYLFTPHSDDDLQKLWQYVRDYSDFSFWIGAATFGPQWEFNDGNTVDFFRLFPATFDNLNYTGGGGGNMTDGSAFRDWFTDLGSLDWTFLGPRPFKRQAAMTDCGAANGDLWPQDRENCTSPGGENGSNGPQLALVFHFKSNSHAYLGYTSVNLASAKYPYVCVKPSFAYYGRSNLTLPTLPPTVETTTFRDTWPDE